MFAQREGNQHPARNGKEATASWGLFSVGGEGGLCSSRGMGGRKSSGTEHPLECGKGNSRWRLLWVSFFCDIDFPTLFRPLLVTSTAVGRGLELLLFIATCCPYQALKVAGAWN